MCKDRNRQRELEDQVRNAAPYASRRAVYSTVDGTDLLGFFLEYRGKAVLLEVKDDRVCRPVEMKIPFYTGMGNSRVAEMLCGDRVKRF